MGPRWIISRTQGEGLDGCNDGITTVSTSDSIDRAIDHTGTKLIPRRGQIGHPGPRVCLGVICLNCRKSIGVFLCREFLQLLLQLWVCDASTGCWIRRVRTLAIFAGPTPGGVVRSAFPLNGRHANAVSAYVTERAGVVGARTTTATIRAVCLAVTIYTDRAGGAF